MIFGILIGFCGNRVPRHAILFTNPLAEIYKLAAFRTERPKGIILPLNRLVAGRTLFHEPGGARRLVDQRNLVNRAQ
jgi:hypothetical protein